MGDKGHRSGNANGPRLVIGVVVGVAVFWGAIFLVFFQAEGRSWRDFVWGDLEPPPPLGRWEVVSLTTLRTEQSDLVWEERFLLEGGRLIRQRRARRGAEGPIILVSPEENVRRRRRRRLET